MKNLLQGLIIVYSNKFLQHSIKKDLLEVVYLEFKAVNQIFKHMI